MGPALFTAPLGGCKAECTDCLDGSRVDVGVGCARSGVEFFSKILSDPLAMREIAGPLKNVSLVWFLSVAAALMAFEMSVEFGIGELTCQQSSVQSRRAAPRDGNGSDRSMNQSYIERTGQFL